jgi:(2Fe-2S) ferredoxin
MEPFRFRIFVCVRERAAGKNSCIGNGAEAMINALRLEITEKNLLGEVKINTSSCLDLCSAGPNLIVYPQGTWYSSLTVEHVAAFVETQLVQGKVYEPCVRREAELSDTFAPIRAAKKIK